MGLLHRGTEDTRRPAAPENGTPFEPVAVTARYPRPATGVDPDRSKGWIRRLLPLIRPHLVLGGLGMLAAAGSMLLRVEIPQVTMEAIDRALVRRTEPIGGFAVTLAVMAVMVGIAGFVFRYLLQRVAFDIEYSLRVLVFSKLTGLSFSYFDRSQTGQLVSRANSDIRSLQMFLTFGPMLAVTIVTFVLALYYMVRIHLLLTVATLAVVPWVYLVGSRMQRWVAPLSWLVSVRQADVATIVEENVGGVEVVRSFAAEPEQLSLIDVAARRLRWASIRLADVRARYGPVLQNLPRLALALLLLYGGHLVIDGQMTIGALFAFNAYVMLIQLPFMMLGFMLLIAQRAGASTLRIFEILDEVPELQDRPGAVDLVECDGDVHLDNVTFSYGHGGPPLLDGLTLHLRPGETVALVGRTGSGKSTVARLVPRFYDVNEGAVRIGGVDVRDLSLVSVRAAVGLVLDDSFLFSGSVRENISFGRPDAPDDEIRAAARAAGAEDFINEMEHGYETVVGERGSTLSGGQRQRIAIARTLLVNPPVLILDDCTSSIDPHREHEIHGALRTLMQGRTTLIVAHRPSTIGLADRVVLLDGGRIVADGSHEQLLRSVPLYREVLARAHEEEVAPSDGDRADRVDGAAEVTLSHGEPAAAPYRAGWAGPDLGGAGAMDGGLGA